MAYVPGLVLIKYVVIEFHVSECRESFSVFFLVYGT